MASQSDIASVGTPLSVREPGSRSWRGFDPSQPPEVGTQIQIKGADGRTYLSTYNGPDDFTTPVPMSAPPARPGGGPVKLAAGQAAIDPATGQAIASQPAAPRSVARGGSVYDPNTGQVVQSDPDYIASLAAEARARANALPATTAASTAQAQAAMVRAQADALNAQVAAGKLAPQVAKTQLDTYIEGLKAPQDLAAASERGDIDAADATSKLQTAAINNQLALTALNLPRSFHQATADLLNRATGSNTYTADSFIPTNTDTLNALGNAQFLKAMAGVSPYAAYLANAQANLKLPDASTGTPPTGALPGAAAGLPLSIDALRQALAGNTYGAGPAAGGPAAPAVNDYLTSRPAALAPG